MCKVSIIVPVFNGEEYIERFVDCISRQDTKEFEVVFVDDGSTDSSFALLEGCKDRIPANVSIVHQENKGVSAARNVGIEHSRGEIICFCDIDLISDDYISTFIYLMDDSFIDVAVCGSKVYKDSQINKIRTEQKHWNIDIKTSQEALEDFLYMKRAFCVCGGAIRKRLLVDNHIRFAEGYKYNEDLHYMWQVLSYTRKLSLIDKTMYYYIWREGSAMSKFEKSRFDGYHLMKNLEDFFEQNQPDFSPLYKKYAAARIMWSIVRQAASFFGSYKSFVNFFKDYNVKDEMRKLVSYPNYMIKASSLMYICSPYLFYVIIGIYGRRTTHFS